MTDLKCYNMMGLKDKALTIIILCRRGKLGCFKLDLTIASLLTSSSVAEWNALTATVTSCGNSQKQQNQDVPCALFQIHP